MSTLLYQVSINITVTIVNRKASKTKNLQRQESKEEYLLLSCYRVQCLHQCTK